MENEIAKGRRSKGCEFLIKTDIDVSNEEMIMEIRCNIQEIEVNHRDGNHLNNDSLNLAQHCVKHHAQYDSERKKSVEIMLQTSTIE